jgi:AcrR family transcriptional regulator
VNIREVARQAGVSLGSVHYYFPSKQHILEELYQRFVKRMSLNLTDDPRSPDPAARVTAFLEDYFRELSRDPALCQIFTDLWDRAAQDNVLRELLGSHYRAFAAWLTEQIRAGRAAGYYRAANPEAAALAIIALIDGLKIQQLLLQNKRYSRHQRDACIDFIRQAMHTSPTPHRRRKWPNQKPS